MKDFQSKTIKALRTAHPEAFPSKLDDEISRVYTIYCEQFHAAAWTAVDLAEFVRWATTPPIDY